MQNTSRPPTPPADCRRFFPYACPTCTVPQTHLTSGPRSALSAAIVVASTRALVTHSSHTEIPQWVNTRLGDMVDALHHHQRFKPFVATCHTRGPLVRAVPPTYHSNPPRPQSERIALRRLPCPALPTQNRGIHITSACFLGSSAAASRFGPAGVPPSLLLAPHRTTKDPFRACAAAP